MKIKRYLARNMPEALNMVREDLGREAVIIFSRKVRGKGLLGFLTPPLIEVTAAVDRPALAETEAEPAPPVSPLGAGTAGDRTARVVTPVNAAGMPSVIPPAETVSAPERVPSPDNGGAPPANGSRTDRQKDSFRKDEPLRRELTDLKRMLGRLLERQSPSPAEDPLRLQWRRLLEEMEIDAAIAEQVLERLTRNGSSAEEPVDRAEDLILQGLREVIEPAYTEVDLKKVLVFAGPTGVGKTTTLAKLAARFALIEHRRVAMVTIDTYRLGAVEQLRTYAEIMDLPLEVVLTPADLAQALARQVDADYILIDTAGRPSKNQEQVRELKNFLDVIDQPFDVLLVLSSNTKMRDLARIARDFEIAGYSKLIFTKVDETESLGCLINVMHEVRRPVVYITNGQNVPYDIHAVHPQKVARMLMERTGSDA